MSETKRRLMLWAVGTDRVAATDDARRHTAAVVLESGDHLRTLHDTGVIGTDSMVFVPESDPAGRAAPGDAELVPYEGAAHGSGSEFSLGGRFFLQIQKYSISQYMSVVGPTLVRIEDEEDFAVFVQDADDARAEGRFPAFLTNPLVHLADVVALGGPWTASGPAQRLYVASDGTCSISPTGSPLGVVGEPLDALDAQWRAANAASTRPCAVALGGSVAEQRRVTAVLERPWLADYLAALDTLRQGAARGATGLKVSGFGGRLAPDGFEAPVSSPGGAPAPVVAYNEQGALVHDVRSGRTLGMDVEVATLVDLLVGGAGLEHAARFAPLEALRTVEAKLAQHGMLVPAGSADVGA